MTETVKLLGELTRQGIELQAHGDCLRFRPRSSVGPDLIERLTANRDGLLAILSPDHELNMDERVALGYVAPGWTPDRWADRLRQLADHCETIRPDLAETYRLWAGNIGTAPKDRT